MLYAGDLMIKLTLLSWPLLLNSPLTITGTPDIKKTQTCALIHMFSYDGEIHGLSQGFHARTLLLSGASCM